MSRCGLRSQGPSVRANFPKSPKIRKKSKKWGKEAYIYAFLTIFHDFSLIFHCCPSPTHPGPSPPRTLDGSPPATLGQRSTTHSHHMLNTKTTNVNLHSHPIHHPSKTLENPPKPPRPPHPPPLLLYQPLRSRRHPKKLAKPCYSCPRRRGF